MRDSKPLGRSLLAAATIAALGAGLSVQPEAQDFTWKRASGNKGRSNNKPGARAKDRARAKAAHKSRMAQKRRK